MRRHPPVPSADRTRAPRRDAGFSLLEVMIGGVLLGLALLSHAASTVSEHRLARSQQVRSEVLHVMRQFMDRLRADEDWPTLYSRLDVGLRSPVGPGDRTLADGRVVRPPQTYYPGVTVGQSITALRVHVDVPRVPVAAGPGVPVASELREDVALPRFGLPADLDGDGLVGADPLNDTYHALPVVVTFHWEANGEAAEEIQVRTWLRGDR